LRRTPIFAEGGVILTDHVIKKSTDAIGPAKLSHRILICKEYIKSGEPVLHYVLK